mmetsp:Transcript_22904/g.57007  ORF Transcript_22904/g.57007 Transcript_22904/m.57007 type:complete len:94 (+) Transcript_22904:742-1023(+)
MVTAERHLSDMPGMGRDKHINQCDECIHQVRGKRGIAQPRTLMQLVQDIEKREQKWYILAKAAVDGHLRSLPIVSRASRHTYPVHRGQNEPQP